MVRDHLNQVYKPDSTQATPSYHSKVTPPWGEGKINTTPVILQPQAVGWGQTVGLIVGSTHHENFRRDNTEKVHCGMVLLYQWKMSSWTQLKPEADAT